MTQQIIPQFRCKFKVRTAEKWVVKGVKGHFSLQNARNIWVFPRIGVPGTPNGWFIMENPIKMDDLGGTKIFGNIHLGLRRITGRWQLKDLFSC